jgi:hypothetical protein
MPVGVALPAAALQVPLLAAETAGDAGVVL